MSTQIYQTYTFDPTKISGCQLWLDGADSSTLSLSGNNVSQWNDKSGKGNNVSQATSLNQPTYTANGVLFDGTNDFLLTSVPLSSLITASNCTVFLYGVNYSVTSSGPSYTGPMFICDENAWFGIFISSNQIGIYNWDGNADYAGVTYTTPNSAIITAQHSNNTISASLFGNTPSTTASGNTGNLTFQLALGRSYGGRYYTNCRINELLIYNVALTTSQIQQVEGYLAWKWGLQGNLPTTHPYKKFPPFMNTIQLPQVPSSPIIISNVAVFLPTQLSGCVLWLDGSDPNGTGILPANGASITTWVDKSTSANNATGGSAPTFSARARNTYGVVNFNASQYLTLTPSKLPNGSTPFTFFSIIRTIVSRTQVYLSWGNTLNSLGNGRAPQLYISNYNLANDMYGASGTSDTTVYNGVYVMNSVAASTTINSWDNGNPFTTTGTAVSPSLNTGTTFAYVGVGQVNNVLETTFYLNGQIAEITGYNRVLSTSERQQVEGYLAWKWGLQASLPTTHPYYKSPFPNMSMAPTPPYPPQITSSSWQPVNISSCVLWLDAADSAFVVRSGTTISQWKDKSPSTNNTTSASGSPQYAQNLLNKNPGVVFNGSSSYFTLPVVVNTDWSIFLVLSTTATGTGAGGEWWGGSGIFDAEVAGTTSDFGTSLYGSTFAVGVGNPPTGDNTLQSSTSVNTGAGFICEFQRISSSGFFENFVNGSSQGSTTGGIGVRSAPTRIVLGALQTLTTYFNGNIFEVVVYSTYLSSQNRQKVEGYLAWKWGLVSSLPSNHPYKLFPPVP